MGTIDEVSTRSPRILMIGGRDHVLYQGSMSRIRIADAKMLWLDAAKGWGITIFAVLAAINAVLPKYSMWLALVGLAAIFSSLALTVFIGNRAALTIPFAVVANDSAGESTTLTITSSSQRVFSTNPTVTQFATVSPEMADFLLTAFTEGHFGSYRKRPRVPAALTTSGARRQAWTESASLAVALLGTVSIFIAVIIR